MEPIDAISTLSPTLGSEPASAQALTAAARNAKSGETQKLQDAAKKFEGLCIRQILKQMKAASASLESDSEDPAADQVKGMYWDFWADAISQRGGFGFWKQIYQQLNADAAASGAPAAPRLDERM